MAQRIERGSLIPAAVQKLRNVFSKRDILAEFQEACACPSLAVSSDELDAILQVDFVG